jgi:predicted transcriptional regulator of viral defense system
MPAASHKVSAVAIARRQGVVRARDFDALGVPRVTLRRLTKEGVLINPARGFYQLAGAELSGTHSLAEAVQAAPKGVIALLSALQFHRLTSQTPHQVWMLLPSNAWVPRNPPVSLKIIRANVKVQTAGVEWHLIDGIKVAITSPAKTIADCFKHRNKVGLDVALEALREGLRRKRATADDIWRFALIDRVGNVMRPYLEGVA